MAPSVVNNSARQGNARIAEILADLGGALVAGGGANAITVTANSAFTAYADGLMLSIRITTDNTTATTINANGLGAKSVRKMLASGESALTGAELQATGVYDFRYSTALNSAAGGWLLLNPTIDVTPFAPIASPAFTGNPTAPTPTAGDNDTSIATTAFVAAATATLNQPALTLEQSTTPIPTAEGRVQWDTDDNVLVIGDGAATKIFLPIPASTAAGDIEYFTAAKVKARLAKGTALQALLMNAGATAPAWTTLPFTKSFESSQQTLTGGGALTLAHGLGGQPKLYMVVLQCVTAEAGYSIGDEVLVNPSVNDPGSGGHGLSVSPDATNINVRMSASQTLINASSGAWTGITNANWKLVARAWA